MTSLKVVDLPTVVEIHGLPAAHDPLLQIHHGLFHHCVWFSSTVPFAEDKLQWIVSKTERLANSSERRSCMKSLSKLASSVIATDPAVTLGKNAAVPSKPVYHIIIWIVSDWKHVTAKQTTRPSVLLTSCPVQCHGSTSLVKGNISHPRIISKYTSYPYCSQQYVC